MKSEELKEQITKAVGNWEIPWVYPVQEGNFLTRTYKRLICRMTRCAVRPLAEQETETNYGIKKAFETMADVIAQQDERIRSLEKQIASLKGEKASGGKGSETEKRR